MVVGGTGGVVAQQNAAMITMLNKKNIEEEPDLAIIIPIMFLVGGVGVTLLFGLPFFIVLFFLVSGGILLMVELREPKKRSAEAK